MTQPDKPTQYDDFGADKKLWVFADAALAQTHRVPDPALSISAQATVMGTCFVFFFESMIIGILITAFNTPKYVLKCSVVLCEVSTRD